MNENPPQTETDPTSWVEEHGDVLYRYALLRVKDPHVAEDLVQETFIAALEGLPRFKGNSSIRTWLVGILKHKIIDSFRRGSKEIASSDLTMLDDEPGDEATSRLAMAGGRGARWEDDPSSLLQDKEFWHAFRDCLHGLPPALQKAFSLRELDGLKTVDICKILAITPTNLWVMLHRARARLRDCLDTNWPGEGQR